MTNDTYLRVDALLRELLVVPSERGKAVLPLRVDVPVAAERELELLLRVDVPVVAGVRVVLVVPDVRTRVVVVL